jgi:hypothetical protein
MVEHRGEVDRRRVAADADSVDGARRRRGRNNHEAQRKRRQAPDQTQCQYSAINELWGANGPTFPAINDMKAKEIKGFPPSLRS